MVAKAKSKKAARRSRSKKPARSKRAEVKTRPTAASVDAFLAKVPNETRRKDAGTALALLRKVTGQEPKLWGPSIVGFGEYHYRYESGAEGRMCMTGFSPRAAATVFYVMGGVPETDPLFQRLGKFKLGRSCLYVNRLTDIDLGVLERILSQSVAYMKKTYTTR